MTTGALRRVSFLRRELPVTVEVPADVLAPEEDVFSKAEDRPSFGLLTLADMRFDSEDAVLLRVPTPGTRNRS